MINLLLADDEAAFRQYIVHLLDWEAHGFHLCGVAKNGREALAVAEACPPDVALLDINMPLLDGLDLTERLLQINPDVLVVYITGHTEFEYARRALKLGVEDYLLKPFTRDELLTVLSRLKGILAQRLEAERSLQRDRGIVAEELLARLVEQRGDAKTLLAELARLGVALPHPNCVVAVLELDFPTGRDDGTVPADLSVWKYGVANIAAELLGEVAPAHVFEGGGSRLVALANFGPGQAMPAFQTVLARLCTLVTRYYRFTLSVGLGNFVPLQQVGASYQCALAAAQAKFLVGSGQVIVYESLTESNQNLNSYFVDTSARLLDLLRQNRPDDIRETLAGAERSLKEQHVSADWARMVIMRFLSVCLSYISERGSEIEEVLGEGVSPYRELEALDSVDRCFDYLAQTFLATLAIFNNGHSPRAEAILADVQQYILTHYANPGLNVEGIAAGVFLDTSYIRKLFARHLGCTISDRLTTVRMEAALRLLADPRIPLAEIASLVGYTDPGYFGRRFKKLYGVSPSAYRGKATQECAGKDS